MACGSEVGNKIGDTRSAAEGGRFGEVTAGVRTSIARVSDVKCGNEAVDRRVGRVCIGVTSGAMDVTAGRSGAWPPY